MGEHGCFDPLVLGGRVDWTNGFWGLCEDTSYYRGFALLHDRILQAETRSRQNVTSPRPRTASADP
jgi:hypothetical protein